MAWAQPATGKSKLRYLFSLLSRTSLDQSLKLIHFNAGLVQNLHHCGSPGPDRMQCGVVHCKSVPALEVLLAQFTLVSEDALEVDGLHVVPDEAPPGGLELAADGAGEGARQVGAGGYKLVQLLGVLQVWKRGGQSVTPTCLKSPLWSTFRCRIVCIRIKDPFEKQSENNKLNVGF